LKSEGQTKAGLMANEAITFIDEIARCTDAPQTSVFPTAPSQVFQTTTTEQPSATNAVGVNTYSEAVTNRGSEGVEESTQAELVTFGQRNHEEDIAEDSRDSTSIMRQNCKDQDMAKL